MNAKKIAMIIIPIVVLIAIGIGVLLFLNNFIWHPYKEIEGTYYLYRDNYNKYNFITIEGTTWTNGVNSGEVVYNEPNITLVYGITDTEIEAFDELYSSLASTTAFEGTIKDGVAYLTSGINYFCYCQDGKVPTQEQKLRFSPATWLNFTDDTSDDEECYSVNGVGTYYQTKIDIPPTYEGKQVSLIVTKAFSNCDWITNLTIPSSVRSVQEKAFLGCTGVIENVDGVLYVDTWVIGVSENCKNAKIREGTIGIADGAFKYAESLESVEMANTVVRVGTSAFYGCSKLTSVKLSNKIESISEYAFAQCTSMESIVIPSSTIYVGEGAFYGNEGLRVTNYGATSRYDEKWNNRKEN